MENIRVNIIYWLSDIGMPSKTVTEIRSQDAPLNYELSDTAKMQYELLLDLIDLCTIYY